MLTKLFWTPGMGVVIGAAALALAAGSARAQVYSASPNTPIPDSPTVQNTIHVAGGPASIASLRVIIKVNHTFDSDLDMALIHGNSYLKLTSGNGADAVLTAFALGDGGV